MALGLRVIWATVIRPTWDAIKRGASAMWNWLDRWVFTPIALGFRIMGLGLRIVFERVIRPVWNGIKTVASAAWGWIRDKAFTPLRRGLDVIGAAFRAAKTVIGKAWDGIKAATAAPINFVIETVYTKGIKATWDKIADAVGLDLTLPPVDPIKGYATGASCPATRRVATSTTSTRPRAAGCRSRAARPSCDPSSLGPSAVRRRCCPERSCPQGSGVQGWRRLGLGRRCVAGREERRLVRRQVPR